MARLVVLLDDIYLVASEAGTYVYMKQCEPSAMVPAINTASSDTRVVSLKTA